MLRRLTGWVLALPWAVWAAGRYADPELGHPLAALIAYTPLAAVSAAVAALVALVLGARGAAALAALSAALLGAAVAPRAVADDAADAAPRLPLRVLTANAGRGQTPAAGLRRLVRRHRVDVLSVQELTPRLHRRLRGVLPYTVARPRPGANGTGIYARHPLSPRPAPAGTQNAISVAALRLPSGREVEVHAVHPLPPDSRARVPLWRAELRALPPARAGRGRLRLLAGDFNATLDHAELRAVLRSGYADAADRAGEGLRPTWPSGRRFPPPVTIDHVLIDERCQVTAVSVFDLEASDHRAVLARLELAPCLRRGDAAR